MNKIVKLIGKVGFCSIASMLTVDAVILPAQAATFWLDLKAPPPGPPLNASQQYNGTWDFKVELVEDAGIDKVKFTVLGSNSPSGSRFNGWMYMYEATQDSNNNNKYNFTGTDRGVRADGRPAPGSLTMEGMFITDPKTLMLTTVRSGPVTYDVSNIRTKVPEPPYNLSFLALGTLGVASALKSKVKAL